VAAYDAVVSLRTSPIEILYRDQNVVAVNKPAGLATIPGRGEATSLLQRLAAELNLPHTGIEDPRLRVVHRLDKDTSGVLLFATDQAMQRHLSNQFQNNTVQKEYLAIVLGRPPQDEGAIDAAIGPHPTSAKRMAVLKHGGRPASTLWRVEARFRHHALLRVFPKTGKTHQIRVHLRHIGLPLAVDLLYNPPRKEGSQAGLFLSQVKRDYRPNRGQEERPLIARLTLHAEKLTFVLPDGREQTIVCPLPRDFRATLNQLQKLPGHSRRKSGS
jgi:23S rRNA pseudouridine1911/1915/1917 synthase